MKYRREIDGLRAIAVIPVILFHAGFTPFRGGFVGVDVFFVISGYLITTLILTEKEQGKFSLLDFYARRARRIIPALFLIMLISAFCSWFFLAPFHMKDFSVSLVAVSLFSSNLYFWQGAGYWGAANELKPLLHTWSLAVEEQYYVLFPLFLILMWRFRKCWILISLVLIAAASLLCSQWAAFNAPAGNFFLLPTRAWELAVGAVVAFYFLYRRRVVRTLQSNRAIDELLAWLGLSFIGYAVFAFDEHTPFPGVYALIPTIGTALIIMFSSTNTLAGKLLGSTIPVGVGLVSYSAYLWHQPLLVFARHKSLHEPSSLLLAVLSIASFALAFASWRYVEVPVRRSRVFSNRQILSFTAMGSIMFILFGFNGYLTEGYRNRIDKTLVDSLASARTRGTNEGLCKTSPATSKSANDYCVLVDGKSKYALLYGDSHAETLAYAARKAFTGTGLGLLLATASACPPVRGVYRADSRDRRACYETNNRVYEYIEQNPKIEYVVLAARWTLGMEGTRFDNREGGIEPGRKPHLDVVSNGRYLYQEDGDRREAIARAYVDSIKSLLDSGKKVILVYPVPEAGWNVPDYISRYYWVDSDSVFYESTASTSYEVFKKRNKRTIDALDGIRPDDKLIRILPEKLFCDNDLPGRCITQKDGVLFYRDDNHLTDEGARILLERVISRL